MDEAWIVYDEASGLEVYRGVGPSGSAAWQALGEGHRIVVVPRDMLLVNNQVDLARLREHASAGVDAEAVAVCYRYVTPGSPLTMIYMRKEAQARAFRAGAEPGLFLTREAAARGMTVDAVADEVIALADAWENVGSLIDARRLGAKTAIAAATTIGGIVQAGKLDWSDLP